MKEVYYKTWKNFLPESQSSYTTMAQFNDNDRINDFISTREKGIKVAASYLELSVLHGYKGKIPSG